MLRAAKGRFRLKAGAVGSSLRARPEPCENQIGDSCRPDAYGVAGLLMASYVRSGMPSVGKGYEFKAITASVLGGIALTGGQGNILKALSAPSSSLCSTA
jgi:hypothetical protein